MISLAFSTSSVSWGEEHKMEALFPLRLPLPSSLTAVLYQFAERLENATVSLNFPPFACICNNFCCDVYLFSRSKPCFEHLAFVTNTFLFAQQTRNKFPSYLAIKTNYSSIGPSH